MTDDSLSVPFAETLSYSEALARSLAGLETRANRFGTALSGALTSATLGGKSLEEVLQGLGHRLTDIALSTALKPLEGVVSSAANSLMGSLSSVTAFADGGVVQSPSLFPTGGGSLGLMGEAGAEAILPLRRGADGALGVAMTGGENASAPIIFNVTATDAASFRKSEGQISAMLARSVSRGRRGL